MEFVETRYLVYLVEKSKSLESLVMRGLNGVKIRNIIDAWGISKRIRHLELGNNNISLKGAMKIAQAIKDNTSLVYLGLGYCTTLSNEGIKYILDSLNNHNTTLRCLDLSGLVFQPENISRVVRGLSLLVEFGQSLHTLKLDHLKCTEENCNEFFTVLCYAIFLSKKLKHFHMKGFPIKYEQSLEMALQFHRLDSISIYDDDQKNLQLLESKIFVASEVIQLSKSDQPQAVRLLVSSVLHYPLWNSVTPLHKKHLLILFLYEEFLNYISNVGSIIVRRDILSALSNGTQITAVAGIFPPDKSWDLPLADEVKKILKRIGQIDAFVVYAIKEIAQELEELLRSVSGQHNKLLFLAVHPCLGNEDHLQLFRQIYSSLDNTQPLCVYAFSLSEKGILFDMGFKLIDSKTLFSEPYWIFEK